MRSDEETGSSASLDEVVREHGECMKVVSDVEACLDRPPDGEGLAVLRDELRRLVGVLQAHFSAEEAGALYRDVPVQFPRFSSRIDRLREEHGRILGAAEDVARRADRMHRPEVYELRELNARAQLLVATIRRHEAEENEIIVCAHVDDVGVGD